MIPQWFWNKYACRLELKLERELDRAWATELVQRVEATALAVAAEIVVQHLGRLPELSSITEIVDWASKVGVVKNIEEISPRLKRYMFCQSELSAQSQVPLGRAECSQNIAT